MKEIKGDVLEIGVGTGKNIEYYPQGVNITSSDFSEKMLEKAKNKAEKFNKNVKLLQMDILNPIVVNTYGVNINRRTVENIYKSGFSHVDAKNLRYDIVKKIVIKNDK